MTIEQKLQVFQELIKWYAFDSGFLEYLLQDSASLIAILQIVNNVEEIYLVVDILYNIYT